MASNELHETARALVADNKGILAADESSGTIKKRFDSIDLESTEESRRAYRDMLFTTAGLEEYVSGVILYDETLRQASADGTPFAKLLADRGIIPGIKVDTGRQGPRRSRPARPSPRASTACASGCEEYKSLGARFAKWRAVITIGEGMPTRVLHRGERPRAGALRGPLPGAGARPDRRAGGADGRRPRHRGLLQRDQADAAQDLRRALPPADRPRRDAAEAEHGHLRQGRADAGERAGGRRAHDPVLPRDRARRRCRGSSSSPAASPTSRRART